MEEKRKSITHLSQEGRTHLTTLNKESVFDKAISVLQILMDMAGSFNNAAWFCCLDALDKMKELPQWKRRVDGKNTLEWKFKRAVKAYGEYERTLIWGNRYNTFSVDYMKESARNLYKKKLTNRELYDIWASIGGETYTRTMPLVTALQDQFRLAFLSIGADESEAVPLAWGMCASDCLDIAVQSYKAVINAGCKIYGLPQQKVLSCFSMFSLKSVAQCWDEALKSVPSDSSPVKDSDMDFKNIEQAKRQLTDAWTNPKYIYEDMRRSIEHCGEDVFKDKESIKKVLEGIGYLEEHYVKTKKV